MSKKTTTPPIAPPAAPPTQKPAASAAPARPWGWLLAIIVGLIVATSVAYQPALDNEFVDWDDYTYVVENDLVRKDKTTTADIFKTPISLNYHPLTMLTMRWNNNKCEACIDGISARPFIMGNLILHILNVLLVFGLAYYLSGGSYWLAGVVGLWFGVHPMHVESVAWVSERKDVLYTFFFLGAMATYLRHLQKGGFMWLGATLALFVLACLSKAMAVVLPVVMILLAFWQAKSDSPAASMRVALAPRRMLEYLPFFVVALFFGLMAVKIQSGQNFMGLFNISPNSAVAINSFNTFKLIERFHFAAHGYTSYVANFFVPMDLCTFYPYPTRPDYEGNTALWHAKLAIMLVSLVLALYWAFMGQRKWQKAYVFGLGFYFITVALVLQFLSVGLVIMADRYAYLPYFGLSFGLFYLLLQANKQVQQAAFGVLALIGLWFVVQTRKQVETWQDSETLWEQVIQSQKKTNNIDHAYSVRGHYFGKTADKLAKKGKQDQVKALLDKAYLDFEEAVRLGSQKTEVYEGLGNIYGMRGDYPKALEMYAKAIQLNPRRATLHYNLGVTYGLSGRWAEAVKAYDECEKNGADRPIDLYTNRSVARINAGQYQEALKDLDWLIQNQPNMYTSFTNKGIVLIQLGDKVGARAALEQALRLNPNDALTKERLAGL